MVGGGKGCYACRERERADYPSGIGQLSVKVGLPVKGKMGEIPVGRDDVRVCRRRLPTVDGGTVPIGQRGRDPCLRERGTGKRSYPSTERE